MSARRSPAAGCSTARIGDEWFPARSPRSSSIIVRDGPNTICAFVVDSQPIRTAGANSRISVRYDIIRFIELECGCTFIAALDYAAKFVPNLRGDRTQARSQPRPRSTVVKIDDEDEQRIKRALSIWSDTRQLRGTIAEKYLRSRCIEVPGEALEVLRYHPSCSWGMGSQPGMVALVRDIITNEPCAVHRTALTVDGRKLDRPDCWDRPPAAPSSSPATMSPMS